MFKMQTNESISSWFDRYTTIVNQLNQLRRVIPKDEMVKRLLRSLPKSWRSTVVAIREAKDLNKISLDEICDSLLTYEQEINQIDDEEEKKELVEKKKGVALKTSSQNEELYEDSCEDEDAEIEGTKSLLSMINGWEEEILEKTDFEMSLQATIKSLAMVVNSPNI